MGFSARERIREGLLQLIAKEKARMHVSGVSYKYARLRRSLKELDAHSGELNTADEIKKIKYLGKSVIEEITRADGSAPHPSQTAAPATAPVAAPFAQAYSSCQIELSVTKPKQTKKPLFVKVKHNGQHLALPSLFSLPMLVVLALRRACVGYGDTLPDATAVRYQCLEYAGLYKSVYGSCALYECSEKAIKRALSTLKHYQLAAVEDAGVALTPAGRIAAELLAQAQVECAKQSQAKEGRLGGAASAAAGGELAPTAPPASASTTLLLIDSREQKSRADPFYFHRMLSRSGVQCETRVLSVSDFMWVQTGEGSDLFGGVVVERKTIRDLLGSLRDGRYREQKARLLALPGKKVYLIEGSPPVATAPAIAKAVYTASLRLAQAGLVVISTAGAEETLSAIEAIDQRARQQSYSGKELVSTLLRTSQKKKLEAYPAAERTAILLQSIRGVSSSTAQRVAQALGSISSMVAQASQPGNRAAFCQQLAEVVVSQKGKTVGTRLAAAMLAALGV